MSGHPATILEAALRAARRFEGPLVLTIVENNMLVMNGPEFARLTTALSSSTTRSPGMV